MILRDYQEKAISALRKKFASGQTKRILLVSPTGSGKSLMFCELLRSAYEKKKHAMMVVRGRSLVAQASEKLTEYGVPHGVHMAGHYLNNPFHRIQICSIDTLFRRKIAPDAALVVVDEAHLAGGASYKWLFQHYETALFVPVTATPFVKHGLRHVADEYIEAISMRELIEQKYLVPLKYFAPSIIDVSNVAIERTGDYNNDELYRAANKTEIYGDIVANYQKIIPGKTAIAFGINVEHAKKIQDAFTAKNIPTGYIDAKTPLPERKKIVAKLERREILIIASVGTMTTGVDIPSLEALIIARPTASLNLHLQIIGRVTRTAANKEFGIVLDHAGNVARHGTAELNRVFSLDGLTVQNEGEIKPVRCLSCYAIFCPYENFVSKYGIESTNKKSRYYICPECGNNCAPIRAERQTDVNQTNDELLELSAEQIETIDIRNEFQNLELIRKKTKNKNGKPYHAFFTIHRLIAIYGDEKIRRVYPEKMAMIEHAKKYRASKTPE